MFDTEIQMCTCSNGHKSVAACSVGHRNMSVCVLLVTEI